MCFSTYLEATVLRQAVSPPRGKPRGCSQEWKASGVEHSYLADVLADVPAAEFAGPATVELLLHHTVTSHTALNPIQYIINTIHVTSFPLLSLQKI